MIIRMTNHEVNGVAIVALDGRIVLGEESSFLRESVKNVIAKGNKKIVLNMSGVTYIDSAGLGALVAMHLNAKNHGASMRLCSLGTNFYEIMQITRLLTVFDVYDTEAAAVSSFQRFFVAGKS